MNEVKESEELVKSNASIGAKALVKTNVLMGELNECDEAKEMGESAELDE